MSSLEALSPTAVYDALRSSVELALIDVRERGVFGRAHLLAACNIPLSSLELRLTSLVPCKSTPIVLCDGGEGLVARAHQTMSRAGYASVSRLEGGVEAWKAAGYELFSGLNVPSKAFGEYVEHRFDTPRLDATALRGRVAAGEDLVILDSRPTDEFELMCIPGGIDTPGAELVYRVLDLAPDPRTTVVVNCAGRTRSIIGCQSLVNAGIPNRVMALKDGTMGWHLAGFDLENGATRKYQPVSEAGRAWAVEAAARVASRFGVTSVAPDTLREWRSEARTKTLFVLDVRQPDEYVAGHLPGSRSAPGGQLVQATDHYLAVRNARIVLVDDDGVRATMTASWLVQMGFPSVYVLEGGITGAALESGPEVRASVAPVSEGPVLDCQALRGRDDCLVIDFDDSLSHMAGHIPGAHWAVRSRLSDSVARLPRAAQYVVTASDAALAAIAAADLRDLTKVPVSCLEGGNGAWAACGYERERGIPHPLTEVDDVFERPYDLEENQESAMQAYLDWEVALVDQLERDGTVRFPDFE